jgi:hypothetical protein
MSNIGADTIFAPDAEIQGFFRLASLGVRMTSGGLGMITRKTIFQHLVNLKDGIASCGVLFFTASGRRRLRHVSVELSGRVRVLKLNRAVFDAESA